MTGHGSSDVVETAARLHASLSETTSADDLVRLAILLTEPLHRDDEAIKLLNRALEKDPDNDAAALWFGYAAIHSLMDPDSLDRAARLLRGVENRRRALASAAQLVRIECDDDLKRLSTEERLHLLEASVRSEPSWVFNRAWLAHCYWEQGRKRDAVREMQVAVSNIMLPAAAPQDPWQRAFDNCITGRATVIAFQQAELERMAAEIREATA